MKRSTCSAWIATLAVVGALLSSPARADEECVPVRSNCTWLTGCARGYSCERISDGCGGKVRVCVKNEDDEESQDLLPSPTPAPKPPGWPPPEPPKPPKKLQCTRDAFDVEHRE